MTKTNSHKVAGIYATRADAEAARDAAMDNGFSSAQIEVLDGGKAVALSKSSEMSAEDKAAAVAKDVLGGVTVGTASTGALGVAAVAVGVFVAPPVVAALAGAGLGGLLGGFVGGAVSSTLKESDFAELVREATSRHHWVVILHAYNEADVLRAQDVLEKTAAEASVDQSGAKRPETVARS